MGAATKTRTKTVSREVEMSGEVEERGVSAELAWMDPVAVQLEENVRTDPRITPEFLEAIRAQGVLAPVIAHRDLLGQVVVTDGQRRVMAAREAGLDRIPVMIAGDPGSAEARVVDQLTLNEARSPLTTAERAAAVQQLALFGMEPESVARRIGVRRDQVEDLLKVADQAEAQRVAREVPELTISQAALLADIAASPVAGDMRAVESVEAGLSAAPEQADQVLELARRAVAYEEEFRAAEMTLDERGVRHVREGSDEDDHFHWNILREPADDYRSLWSRATGEWISPEAHESCPGHVVLLCENDHSADIYVEQVTYCEDRVKYGHLTRYEQESRAARRKPQRKPPEEESPAERKAREESQAQRRHVIEMNRLSDSAKVVRDRYVLDLLAQRKPPKDVVTFAVQVLARDYSGWGLSNPGELLAASHALPSGLSVSAWARSSAGSAERVLLAAAIAVCERETTRDFWKRDQWMAGTGITCTYFRQLAAWGYVLSDVEREFCEQVEGAAAKARAIESKGEL